MTSMLLHVQMTISCYIISLVPKSNNGLLHVVLCNITSDWQLKTKTWLTIHQSMYTSFKPRVSHPIHKV